MDAARHLENVRRLTSVEGGDLGIVPSHPIALTVKYHAVQRVVTSKGYNVVDLQETDKQALAVLLDGNFWEVQHRELVLDRVPNNNHIRSDAGRPLGATVGSRTGWNDCQHLLLIAAVRG
jgi:hypothetical protein